ncbi:hypothetical protein [Persephonella sp. KM09-Lau-8]|uniref:hypothetical protein n=1 Tax=Persephonella sp. KM09-Lau-8 TaxID=1158345 RepID=UPI000497B964|nr:hypothetical protein [Persephonella sp. KM09-Lau-8]
MVTKEDIEKFKDFIKKFVEENKRGYPVDVKLRIGNKEKTAKVYFVTTKRQKEKLISNLVPAIEISELDKLINLPPEKQEKEAFEILKEAFDTVKALSSVKKTFNGKIIKTQIL